MSIRVLFICHGNICRSTMCQSVFTHIIKEQGSESLFFVDSAAVSYEEIGNPVHSGTVRELQKNQIPVIPHRARIMTKADYEDFDYLIAMDSSNIRKMYSICQGDPQNKIFKLLSFAESDRDVADPWYTGDFETTFADVYAGCLALYSHICEKQAAEGTFAAKADQ